MAAIVDSYIALDSDHGVGATCPYCKKTIAKFQDVGKLDDGKHCHRDCADTERLPEIPMKARWEEAIDSLRKDVDEIRSQRAAPR